MKEIRVAIVDDKEVFREGLARLLEERPHIRVVSHSGGRYVAAKVEHTKPDLVLMDTNLSACEAIKIIPEIVKLCPTAKVAMLTDSVDKEKLFSCVEAGARGYLIKTLSIDDLVKSIDLIANGRIVISPVLSERFIDEVRKLRQMGKMIDVGEESVISERETEILRLIAKGYTNKEIAKKLFIAENTVKVHVKNILTKLGLRNRQQAAAYAVEHELVTATSDAAEADNQ